MKKIMSFVLLLSLPLEVLSTGNGIGIVSPENTPSHSYTKEGIAQIEKNNQEIAQLFVRIDESFARIKVIYKDIHEIIKSEERSQGGCNTLDAIKRDIVQIKAKTPITEEDKVKLKLYEDSYADYKVKMQKFNCEELD